ncbi:class II aldolase/adducin family protein [Calditrichota bacterium]
MTMDSKERLFDQMLEVASLVYSRNYVVATDGNISVRLPSGNVLISASGKSLGRLDRNGIVEVTSTGEVIGKGLPSSEMPVHLRTFEIRPDIKAVVHAHPTNVVALSLAGVKLQPEMLPEVLMTLGDVMETRFAAPSSGASAEAVGELIGSSDCVIMSRHGSLTVGTDLWEAFDKLERLEYAAKLTYLSLQLGGIKPMTEDEIAAVNISAEIYRKRLSAED